MFYYIKGALTYTDANTAVVEAGGVGYRMTVSQTTRDRLPPAGGQVKLYSYMAVREDGIELFGFSALEELSAFRMLLTVSGVGPKVAVSVLSLLTPEKLAVAVCSEDAKTLGKASGVGAKTAARIILELKDKLSAIESDGMSSSAGTAGLPAKGGKLSDALEGLLMLGYSRPEAIAALRGTDESQSVGDMIKSAMKKLLR